jgi:hypothetical protein
MTRLASSHTTKVRDAPLTWLARALNRYHWPEETLSLIWVNAIS